MSVVDCRRYRHQGFHEEREDCLQSGSTVVQSVVGCGFKLPKRESVAVVREVAQGRSEGSHE